MTYFFCILKEVGETELEEWRSLNLVSNFHNIKEQVMKEMQIEQQLSGYIYTTKFFDDFPFPLDWLTMKETTDLLMQWCRDQGIEAGGLFDEDTLYRGHVIPQN